jgi:MFS family permease
MIVAFAGPMSGAFALIAGILVPVGTELGDVEHVAWIVSGWSTAASVSFTLAGKSSDIFGRRWVLLIGQVFAIIGSVCILAQTTFSGGAMRTDF